MRVAAVLAALLLLAGCGRGVDREVVCGAAEAWLSADADSRSGLADTLRSAVDSLGNEELRRLSDLVGEGDIDGVATEITQYCS
ncbi:hypothetical protein [Amycolatopsis sp. 195334CR]|uniref:hypothetical protein n=1 Tax=Amycolatopsis sp. 195334CR TaxID=2814588 RepID=UPI001A8D07EA|nr:hypothetical protein [Amycolatopsis sp. 195334CR]MBN6041379.1 hypothetical protein [Amycolatopsis sp. 195334CR]